MEILENGGVLLDADEAVTLEEMKADAEKAVEILHSQAEEIATLEAELEEMRVSLEATNANIALEEEIPETIRLELEAQREQIKKLSRRALVSQVDLAIESARTYRDASGRGHAPIVLEIARASMLGEPLAVDGEEEVIALEDRSDAGAVADYNREMWMYFLSNAPGQVNFSEKSEVDDKESNALNLNEKFTTEDFKSLWDN